MRKFIKIILCCLLCLFLIVSIILGVLYCENITKVKELKTELQNLKLNSEKNAQESFFFRDANIKMFWGEWEVTKIISENTVHGADNCADDMIGTIYKLQEDIIYVNNDTFCNYPVYQYYLLENNSTTIKQFIPILKDMAAPEELGISDSLVLFVSVYSRIDFEMKFYVKDSETLILFANNAFYEMKLISTGRG